MKLDTGRLYLFEERVPLRTHQVLRNEMTGGRETMYISKHSPQQLRTQFDFDPGMLHAVWLSARPEADCIPPMNLAVFEARVIAFLKRSPHGIVALNGMEVLERWNGLRPVLEVIRKAQREVNANCTNIVISIDPKVMSAHSVEELEKLSDEVVCT
jgi:hypothetical protein